MGIRLDVPDIARPAPVLGDDPEGAVVEAVGNRVASRPHGLAAGRFQNRSSRRRKPKSKQPADDGIDHILRRSAGKPPLRVTTTRHGFHPNAPDRSLWSRGVGPKTSVPWTALAGFGCAPRPQGPGEREAPDRDHDQVQERRAAMAPGAPSRPPARPRGTRRWRQPTLRPYAVRHEGDRPGVAARRSTTARHPHSRLEGVPRGEPASEAVLAWRRDVGHVSAERATGTSRGHPHADASRAVSGAPKLSTPFEEPDPVQTRSQHFHFESKLARSVIPACVLAPVATVNGRESRGGGGVYAEGHQPDDRERECRESAHVSRRP